MLYEVEKNEVQIIKSELLESFDNLSDKLNVPLNELKIFARDILNGDYVKKESNLSDSLYNNDSLLST